MTNSCRTEVIGVGVDALSWGGAIETIAHWAEMHESRTVCICNAHSLVTASTDLSFSAVLKSADMVTPDGAPVAWMLQRLGHETQQRINGPDLMWKFFEVASQRKISVFFYGATDRTLELLRDRVSSIYPNLIVAGSFSPAFGSVSTLDDQATVDLINSSGAGVVWVGLGCPKQELWMHKQRGRIKAPMIGVGAAFDYHAGTLKRAPLWMQKNGLEWLFRLCAEPRRLWRRYFVTNSLFIYLSGKQLLSRLVSS